MTAALVTGGGGFISGHLIKALLAQGEQVRAVDIRPLSEWKQVHDGAVNVPGMDVSDRRTAHAAANGCDTIYHLAADSGGMGYISVHHADCMTNILADVQMARAALETGARIYYASSSCAYPLHIQEDPFTPPIREADLLTARFNPEQGYGWEKLYAEMVYQAYARDKGLEARIGRYFSVYGPCYDDQTEVLTAQGWKLFADLNPADTIASLDPESGMTEYLTPVAYQAYPYEGPLYRVESARGIDLAVTPDHKLYVGTETSHDESGHTRIKWGLQQAKALKWDAQRMWFSSYGTWAGKDAVMTLPATRWADRNRGTAERQVDSKLWFEFAGWFISEGCAYKSGLRHVVGISQMPGPKQEAIRRCIESLGFGWCPSGSKDTIIAGGKQLWLAVQQFGHGAYGKTIPRWMLDAEPALLQVLFDALMAGDGDADGGRYSTASKQLADDVQELALKIGRRAWISRDANMYRVRLSDRTSTDTRRGSRWTENYSGYVYDVTLPKNHILMVRRNGKPCWSGNCGWFEGGREKAPTALCRKVATAKLTGAKSIEVWGDGTARRTFTYVDDAVAATLAITASDCTDPLNVGSPKACSIDELVSVIEDIAGYRVKRRYVPGPVGVGGRPSDDTRIRAEVGWKPQTSFRAGMEATYRDVYDRVKAGLR